MKQIQDKELFAFMAENRMEEPRIDMVITVSMHESSVKISESFLGPASYFDTVRYFDEALQRFWSTLSPEDLLIIYGDHESYTGNSKTHQVPFIIYCKGHDFSQYDDMFQTQVYTRGELSLYLRKLLKLPTASFKNCRIPSH